MVAMVTTVVMMAQLSAVAVLYFGGSGSVYSQSGCGWVNGAWACPA